MKNASSGVKFRHLPIVVSLGLALLSIFLFFPVLVGRSAFFQRDIHAYWYPSIETAVRAVAEGAWPSWNPYMSFGRPLLADPSIQIFYPSTWLNLVLPPHIYYGAFATLHCWLAGVGVYRLARHHAVSTPAAALAGASWTSSGPLVSAVNLFHHFAGAAWIPWVLLSLCRLIERPTTSRALAFGAMMGAQALAGSADMCLLTALAAGIYLIVGFWRQRSAVGGPITAVVGRAGIAIVFAALLASAQWLPVLAIVSQGSRLALDRATLQYWSVHPASLLDLVVPRLVVDLPMGTTLRAMLFEGRGPLLACLYMGAASVPLVALALTRRHPLRAWAASGFMLFTVAALGRYAVLHGLLSVVPPYSMIRYPAKYLLPASLFWALLSGLGLDVFLNPGGAAAERRRTVAALLSACGIALLMTGAGLWVQGHVDLLAPRLSAADAAIPLASAAQKLYRSAAVVLAATLLIAGRWLVPHRTAGLAAGLFALLIGDLAGIGRGVNPLAPVSLLKHRPPLAEAVRRAGPEARVYVRQRPNAERNALLDASSQSNNEAGSALGAIQSFIPPIGARWQVFGSYDGTFTGMEPVALSGLNDVVVRLGDHPLALKLLQVAAVTHVIALGERPFSGFPEIETAETVYGVPVRLFQVPDPLPRAYVVHAARTVSSDDALAALVDPKFDPRYEVLLDGPSDGALSRSATSPPVRYAPARVVRRRADALDIDIEAPAPGWLVLAEAHEAGWTARVDGAPAPMRIANILFRAVPVPPGRHQVELRYWPRGLTMGLWLSGLAIAVGLTYGMRRQSLF